MSKCLVVFPTYLHERFLKETIQAFLDQTFTDFKMIIINDFSPDRSQDVINSFKDDKIFTWFPHKELGTAGKTINEAFKAAKIMGIDAPLECRVDGDNTVCPNFLEELVKVFDEEPDTDFAYSQYRFNKMNDKDEIISTHHLASPTVDREKLKNGYCLGPSVMWTKKIREKVGFPNERHEDWIFPAKILLAGGKFRYVNKILMDYRYHHTNIQSRTSKEDDEKYNNYVREMFIK